MNLRTKLHLASGCLVLVMVTGMMGALFISERRQMENDLARQQREELNKLARVGEESFLEKNELILLNYVKSLVVTPKVAYAGYVSADATSWLVSAQDGLRIFGRQDARLRGILESVGPLRREVIGEQGEAIIEVSGPLRGRGHVLLGYSRDAVMSEFRAHLLEKGRRFILVGLAAILVGLVLAQLMSVALARPIKLLVKGAEAIAKGKKGVTVPVKTADELGHLTHTFNHMSAELSKLDQMKDDFMSHVTHELRSPLTSIIATVELLADLPAVRQDAKLSRYAGRLTYGSERLNRLVDNILDLTRMEAGKMRFDIRPTDLGAILHEMADFFVPRAMEKGLRISAKTPTGFPPVAVDPERIRQVLSNLIHNAIKFTNEGGITLRLEQKGEMAEVAVMDTGVGIPPQQVAAVFEKFETLQDTRDRVTRPVPGSGLGLNIVKNSIAAQGGRIWVESEVGKGSSFIFLLPLASATTMEQAVAPPAFPATAARAENGTAPDGSEGREAHTLQKGAS